MICNENVSMKLIQNVLNGQLTTIVFFTYKITKQICLNVTFVNDYFIKINKTKQYLNVTS